MPTETEVVLSVIGQLNEHSTAGMRPLWSPGIVERFPDRTCHGPDELAAYFQAAFDAFPDFRLEPQGHAGEGESVFVRWRLSGTHTGGTFQGIAPTGKRVELDGIDHFTVRDGVVVSNVVVFDQMAFARQLGLMPPDASVADRALKGAFNGVTAARRWVASRRS
jgi:predicted ester cyclase